MKKYLLVMAFMVISASCFAQATKERKPLSFNVGAELALPVGDLNGDSPFGFGGSILSEYIVKEKFGATFSAGYINYTGRSYSDGRSSSTSQIPVLAGVRYYIEDIYLSGQAGISFLNRGLGSAFTYAPGIGAKFSVMDVTLKYMGAVKGLTSYKEGGMLSNISLRVAFFF